jgi:hypothetical protein
MAMNDSTEVEISKTHYLDPLAGLLSFLIPGLGQVYQGRILKGLLFFACLWGLFFYGMSLGNWRNVYFPPRGDPDLINHGDIVIRAPLTGLVGRDKIVIPHTPYLAQFCIGIAAWPAIFQANTYDLADLRKENPETVHPYFGTFQRYPNPAQQERMLRHGDRTGDLGWVYTIIAGLLNLLVIYDALAGPAHGFQSIPMTTFLMFLLALTGLCLLGFVGAGLLMLAGVIHSTLYMQLPVVLAIVSLVYSATRFDRWWPIVLEAVHWGWRMAAFLLVIGLVLFLVARPPFVG